MSRAWALVFVLGLACGCAGATHPAPASRPEPVPPTECPPTEPAVEPSIKLAPLALDPGAAPAQQAQCGPGPLAIDAKAVSLRALLDGLEALCRVEIELDPGLDAEVSLVTSAASLDGLLDELAGVIGADLHVRRGVRWIGTEPDTVLALPLGELEERWGRGGAEELTARFPETLVSTEDPDAGLLLVMGPRADIDALLAWYSSLDGGGSQGSEDSP